MSSFLSPRGPLGRYLREPFNGISHGIGAILSVVGLIALLIRAGGEPWRTTSFAIYGLSLVLLYTASTLLHSLHVGPRGERMLRLFDHAAIYLLIAGTYTPVTLITLQQGSVAWGWTLFGIAWGVALLGITFKVLWLDAPRWLTVGMYLLMGWLAVIAISPILQTFSAEGLFWLALGGAFYSLGAIIYGFKKPDWYPEAFGHHGLWHLFVLAGSASHFIMMLRQVLPG